MMKRRRLVAIGDLHGDVHRLVRILQRQEVLLPQSHTWARNIGPVDVVLLGDYVDWRGEPLEGNPDSWEHGVANLMELIVDLHRQITEIHASSKFNTSRFIPLLGNHDKLMLDAYKYLSGFSSGRREALGRDLERKGRAKVGAIERFFSSKAQLTLAERFLTWILNGGMSTIRSFGGFKSWYERMDQGLATFIEEKLRLGVVINGRLYSHSVPDDAQWWRPMDEIEQLPPLERDEAIEQWVWGRRINGFDSRSGAKVDKPPTAEVDKMLSAMGVQGVVMGHSLMRSLYPVRTYEGKVVNIDFHGHPLSEPWLDEYSLP